MSTLNANSSLPEVLAEYDNNASYDEDGSVAKARAFITAVRFMMRYAQRERKGGIAGAEHEFNLEVLREELKDAREYVEAYRTDETTPYVLDVDFTEFDDRA